MSRNETLLPARRVGALALYLAWLLAACATPDWGPPPETPSAAGAESAFAAGDFEQAATLWQERAVDSGPAEAARLRISAADAWLLAGRPDRAEELLRWIERSNLTARDRARLDLVLADLALRANRPDEAATLLRQASPALPAASRSRFDELQARAQRQLTDPAMRDLSRAATQVEGMGFYDVRAALELMRVLENVSSGELAIRAENPRADRQLTGWLDLALVIRQHLVRPEGVGRAMAQWKLRHPYHLLTEEQALDTWLSYRQQFRPPGRVAVLLPESGRFQAASAAIRDGLMSAYLDDPGGAEILFFATGADDASAISAYFNALDAGADLIIGPLRKEAIEAMLNLAGMATPVLALNELPAGFDTPAYLQGQLHGISLSQEQEAASAARRAAALGYQRAMVLAPEGGWGERMALAFEAEFLHGDREIVAAGRYLESQNDHSSTLERVLKIDESKARRKKLENTLQMPLEFEATRRDDVDVIFLAANSGQARLIRPQLRFHDAGDIPVYSTGRVFSGQPDPSKNQDLNGLRFAAAPWHLRHSSPEEIPGLDSLRRGTLGALFALGQDAWKLLPWLGLMDRDRGFVFSGESGNYRSSEGGMLQREPAWAEFRRGRPAPLPDPVPMITPADAAVALP
ncbi:MAG: penicillin-binding protein activator [Gammaproteobacteria bacterium]|nr:penicillin-binding protein activator [Gammaproteobacteria bacterium]NNK32847.1 penicillin-binding protein activator [Xanthomonadales bacterium]